MVPCLGLQDPRGTERYRLHTSKPYPVVGATYGSLDTTYDATRTLLSCTSLSLRSLQPKPSEFLTHFDVVVGACCPSIQVGQQSLATQTVW